MIITFRITFLIIWEMSSKTVTEDKHPPSSCGFISQVMRDSRAKGNASIDRVNIRHTLPSAFFGRPLEVLHEHNTARRTPTSLHSSVKQNSLSRTAFMTWPQQTTLIESLTRDYSNIICSLQACFFCRSRHLRLNNSVLYPININTLMGYY